MAEFNPEWGKCITDLLERHRLNSRTAEARVGGKVSHTYIYFMMQGKVPEYQKAYEFLKAFPHEEAIKCLKVASIPIPTDWLEPIEALEAALNVKHNLSEEKRAQIVNMVRHELENLE